MHHRASLSSSPHQAGVPEDQPISSRLNVRLRIRLEFMNQRPARCRLVMVIQADGRRRVRSSSDFQSCKRGYQNPPTASILVAVGNSCYDAAAFERAGISMKVVVVPHDPKWVDRFAIEREMVAQTLGSNVAAIHHIGSTAIPTVYAKPIIDMLIEVENIDEVDAYRPAMEELGYEALGEFGIPGRRYFRKESDAGIRTHHAHAFATGCPEIARHLAFRDFMIAHPDWAARYSDLKQTLATAHLDNIELYMDGKDAFIKEIDRRAAVWRVGSDD